ncbi:MAG TPA: OmpA family protein [Polyangiaceae bacterium]|jgi:chemotaxis protein MotB|nr:MAG: Motility protein B [Deltaproteobacteria bacterium ADurb.Bin207]HNS97676.1 OmpA family protein [Polyangiaceae bacterium]HNZ24755.1 OmpA family protein [Polyangiaceae bacterium]HOD24501.1 OmpA family protein [Polyangiaceae bacterium]HOE51624.1 OmpA family protein [Polyangiaceae bacterium]
MRRVGFFILTTILASSTFGCVKKSEFDAKVAELAQCQGTLGRCAQDFQNVQAQAKENEKKAVDTQALLDARTERANHDLAELQKNLDESTAFNASLRAELERMGANVDKLLQEKGALSTSLEAAKARLEELRRAQAAAERRAQQMKQLIERFRKMADAGQLQVDIRKGRMVLQLPNDVLFDSGRAAVKPGGKLTLQEVASILRTIPNRQFQVAGHTDNEPIRSSNYPSNWYLSASRAIKVVEILVEDGVAAHTLSACGYGEFDPLHPNDSEENKAKNRRIEIVIQPNVDELLAVDSQTGW